MPSTSDLSHLINETVWLERQKYEEAERIYQEGLVVNKRKGNNNSKVESTLKPTRESKQKVQVEEVEMEEAKPPSKQESKGSGKKGRHNKNKEKKVQEGTTVVSSGDKGSKVAVNKRDGKEGKEAQVTEKAGNAQSASSKVSLADEISRARQHIKNSLKPDSTLISSKVGVSVDMAALTGRIGQLEDENKRLSKVTDDLRCLITKLELRVVQLEGGNKKGSKGAAVVSTPPPPPKQQVSAVAAADDDVDLFASDDENDEEKEKLHQERLKAYETKKSKKPALVAKSNVILDVKPWDDETDMKAMETQVRTIVMDGLLWGASKLVALAYGIHKLQISCVVEDDKVSIDLLQEQIESFDDLVQSVDIAAFNKV